MFFIFSRKARAERAFLKIVNILESLHKKHGGDVLDGLRYKEYLDFEYNPHWKDLSRRINDLIKRLKSSINDNYTQAVATSSKYIKKLLDSYVGDSNYYEELQEVEEQMMLQYDIEHSEWLDKAHEALLNYEKNDSKQTIYASHYENAIIQSQLTLKAMEEVASRARKSDMERAKRMSRAHDISPDIEKKIKLYEFFMTRTRDFIEERTELNQRWRKSFGKVEIPVSKNSTSSFEKKVEDAPAQATEVKIHVK